MLFPSFVEVLCLARDLLCSTTCVLSSCAIILMGNRELVALLWLSFWCLVTISVLWLSLAVSSVGLQLGSVYSV